MLAGDAGGAAVDHDWGDVDVDGPADHEVEDVAGYEPRYDEDAEGDVAGELVAGVFEHFRDLWTDSWVS